MLRVSEPGEIVTVEFDVLGSHRERIVFRVSRVDGDLSSLDLGDDMEGCIVAANAEGDGKLTATGIGMDSKGSIARSNKNGSVFSIPSRSEFSSTFQVSEDTNGFGEIALGRRNVVGTSHDDSKLGLKSEL